MTRFSLSRSIVCTVGALLLAASPVLADGGVSFTDIAEDGGAGIDFAREVSPRQAQVEALNAMGQIDRATWPDTRANETPMKAPGSPGVALFDYDGDGDLDIYATNGPGAANSLFSNQLMETGTTTFVDVAQAAGVGATDQESQGVCYGDIDNDGDHDLYVLGTGMPNILFENNGNGTFTNITAAAGVAAGNRHTSGCTMADFDGNGYLDILVGNTYDDWTHRRPTFINETYPGLEHNQLFMNQGGNVFSDESAASGIETIVGMPGGSYTWALSAADYDQDGDVDIIFADTQGALPTNPSEERGYNRIFQNDGTGNFTDVTEQANMRHVGSWMGLSFGDFNCDGHMDIFSTGLGNYVTGTLDAGTSRWFLGGPDGVFTDPGIGDLISSAFGWGTVTFDYDNDGDTDIAYYGGMDVMTVIVADNPGIILQNEGCTGDFAFDLQAVPRDHGPRLVEGLATGDLNNDGFNDMVSISGTNVVPSEMWYLPWSGILAPPYSSVLDPQTFFEGQWINAETTLDFLGTTFEKGNLAVELNSADNGNNWAKVQVMGTTGIIPGGAVNRDGIGAVVHFTPQGGVTSMRPVVGGASYASQDSLVGTFGLGDANRGHVDVLWPGGVKNRLYNVKAGEHLVFPEIPCSYDDTSQTFRGYLGCVSNSLEDLVDAGVLDRGERTRFLLSALRAWGVNLSAASTADGLCSDDAALALMLAGADEDF